MIKEFTLTVKNNFVKVFCIPNPKIEPSKPQTHNQNQKKCTPFKPCLQQNTGIFSEFDKTGVNYPIFWMIWFFQVP
jgi:hypothetical protein